MRLKNDFDKQISGLRSLLSQQPLTGQAQKLTRCHALRNCNYHPPILQNDVPIGINAWLLESDLSCCALHGVFK
ncbi:hypothetical protein ATO11_20445 [Pseudaestuariivita atlantica]|uniref:Uncharacterized protein n=1 Tax=Pseudaestuariivita atlantica TaxID=1317121 RepID=A0A0L1JJC8_9RHOB|nr:hypothetical protein ATO11_20445 [Pseudaestuariivita atlantica]